MWVFAGWNSLLSLVMLYEFLWMALSESQNEHFHQPQSTKIQKIKSSVIRKKGESHNGCFKKTKHPKFFEKQAGGKKMFVFRKIWRALFSWNTHFEIRPIALLPTKSNFLEVTSVAHSEHWQTSKMEIFAKIQSIK